MEASDSPPPAKRARRFVSPRGKQSGGFAWLAVFEILYYVIVIDHFLAYMNIRRGSKIYTRVGDFDPPTHQPTNIYIYIYIRASIHRYCACAALRTNVAGQIGNRFSSAESAFSACIESDQLSQHYDDHTN